MLVLRSIWHRFQSGQILRGVALRMTLARIDSGARVRSLAL